MSWKGDVLIVRSGSPGHELSSTMPMYCTIRLGFSFTARPVHVLTVLMSRVGIPSAQSTSPFLMRSSWVADSGTSFSRTASIRGFGVPKYVGFFNSLISTPGVQWSSLYGPVPIMWLFTYAFWVFRAVPPWSSIHRCDTIEATSKSRVWRTAPYGTASRSSTCVASVATTEALIASQRSSLGGSGLSEAGSVRYWWRRQVGPMVLVRALRMEGGTS